MSRPEGRAIAYTAPPNFTTGQIVTEANLDTLSNDITFLAGPPRARVYNNAAITLTTATTTAITFNSELWDTDTMHSTASNTDRLTATTAGLYSAGFSVEFAANATGLRQAYIERFNSAGTSQGLYAAVSALSVGAAAATQLAVGGVDIDMSAGDFLRLYAFQNSGGNLNVNAQSKWSPHFWARLVAV